MSEWRRTTLGRVCAEARGGIQTGPFGSQLHASDYVENGVPVVMPVNIGDNVIDYRGIARISVSKSAELSRHSLTVGDIVYSRRGDVERRALVRPHNAGWLCGTGCLRVRIRDQHVHDPAFLSYALGLPETRKWITQHAVGATMLNLNTQILGAVPLRVPALNQQRAIAEVLGALDDKIAANDRIIRTSDSLSSVLFSSMLKGDIDEVPLSDTAEFVNGRAFTKGASGTGRVVIRIAELNSGIGGSTVFSDVDVPDIYLARPGDLLFAWSGSLTVHRWYRPEAIVNQHIFKVIPKPGYPLWCVNELLRRELPKFKAIASDKATTMGHIQRHHLDEQVAVPTERCLNGQDARMKSLWSRGLAAERENVQLAETRDMLLPLLMSGKIRVTEAEEVVQGVV